jgi:hypothetical protein
LCAVKQFIFSAGYKWHCTSYSMVHTIIISRTIFKMEAKSDWISFILFLTKNLSQKPFLIVFYTPRLQLWEIKHMQECRLMGGGKTSALPKHPDCLWGPASSMCT